VLSLVGVVGLVEESLVKEESPVEEGLLGEVRGEGLGVRRRGRGGAQDGGGRGTLEGEACGEGRWVRREGMGDARDVGGGGAWEGGGMRGGTMGAMGGDGGT
jgi:hypothetical protein